MLRLFHSYQYISNSKEIFFDKEAKQLKTSNGSFLLGLLQIPDIPNYELIVEKYLVSKRQSKKVNYRNHTKHNMRIFVKTSENDIDNYLSKYVKKLSKTEKQTQLNYLFNLLKRNYLQFSLDQNIFDIICLNLDKKSNPFCGKASRKVSINLNKNITIGDNELDIINKKYKPKPLETICLNKEFDVDGGILFIKLNNENRNKLVNLLNNTLSNSICLVFEDEFEFNIWKYFIKNKFKNHVFLESFINKFGTKIFSIKLGNLNQIEHLIYIPKETNNEIEIIEKNISVTKVKLKIVVNNLWLIVGNKTNLTLNFIKKFIEIPHFKINKLDFFPSSDNIYGISKIIHCLSKSLGDNSIVLKEILLDRKLHNLLKVNKLNLSLLNTQNSENQCNICLGNNLTFMKTSCGHKFCLNCYINHINIKIKEGNELGCCLCRQILHGKEMYLYKDIENLNYFKNIDNEISNKEIKDIIYFNEKTALEYTNIESIIKYYTEKHSKKFFALNNKTELLKKAVKHSSNLLIFCNERDNIDKIYNESTKIFKIVI